MSGCKPDVPEAVVVNTPVQSHICQLVPPLYPGCDCPPAPCASGATPQIVVTYTSGPPMGVDGDPFLIPTNASHTDKTGRYREPLPQNGPSAWPSTLTFAVKVDTNGVPIPNQTVTLSLNSVDSGGRGSDSVFGHYHSSSTPPKPKGTLSTGPVSTGSSGVASVTYTAGQVSGPIILVASALGVDTLRRRWSVGISGLFQLAGPHVTLIGDVPQHPHNYYGTIGMNFLLNSVAGVVYAKVGKPLVVNDMSLKYGGKFDLDTLWTNNPKRHVEHRLGISADIRIIADPHGNHSLDGLADSEPVVLKKGWNSLDTLASWIYEGSPPHIHLRYWGQE